MIRVVDNKAIELTEAEFELYNKICEAYSTTQFNGKDLFRNLFETDEKGIIIFLKPPSNTQSSLEVYLFLVSIMVHQHLRISTGNFDAMIKAGQETIAETKQVLGEAKQLIDEMRSLKMSEVIKKDVG